MILIDSADPKLTRDWATEGHLPTIASLLQNGDHRDINNLPGFGSTVFWASMLSGVDPSYHGRYYLAQPEPPDYAIETCGKDSFSAPPFWKTLEQQGRHIAVFDAIESPVAGLSNGIEIYDWLSHRREGPPGSYPPGLIEDLMQRYGDDPFEGNANMAYRRGMSEEELIRLCSRRAEQRTRATQELMDSRDWDLFMVNYSEPHDIGHLAWHLHYGLDPSANNANENPLLDCYKYVDAAIAELLPAVGSDGKTLILLGPGMETLVTFNRLLPEILATFQGRQHRPAKRWVSDHITRFLISGILPERLSQSLLRSKRQVASKARQSAGQRYFAIPHTDNAGAVRLSLKGREPAGLVEPGTEYDELCDEISERLLTIRDATGDKPIVTEIVRVHRDYSGPQINRLPDLLVVWNRQAETEFIQSPEIGTLENSSFGVRSGDHSSFGMLISSYRLEKSIAQNLQPMEVKGILTSAV